MKPPRTKSTRLIWAGGIFVTTMFLLLWTFALSRLIHHADGESFLHANGALDSALAILAPAAVAARLWQMTVMLRRARTS